MGFKENKNIVDKFLEDEVKGVPQMDPVWFESLEYDDGNFTMDIKDILLAFKEYYDKVVNQNK